MKIRDIKIHMFYVMESPSSIRNFSRNDVFSNTVCCIVDANLKIEMVNLILLLLLMWRAAVAVGCCVGKSLEGPRRAVVEMKGTDIDGKLVLEQASLNSPVKIRGVIYGLEPGQHGIHIHQGSSLGNECELVGPQFNPTESERPIGFLGNVKVIKYRAFALFELCHQLTT